MDAKTHLETMKPDFLKHLRETVTMSTGPVTEIRKEAAAEIERLNAALSMTREGVDPDEAKRIHKCIT